MDLNSLTIDSTRTAIAEKKISASSLVEQFYLKIKAEDPEVHAYLTLCEDRATRQAKAIDDQVSQGASLPPLAGVPFRRMTAQPSLAWKPPARSCWAR
jgi:aspartyl-tRNA(Asn)/glutamyl-tRNA(Gln) amidotransferase subunit A